MASTSAMAATLRSPLSGLPRALWLVIAQFLSLSEKLTHISRLSRSLSSLAPTSFAHDHLPLSTAALSALTSSPSLLQNLGAVPSLSYDYRTSPTDTWRALECFASLLSCHSFPALQSVDLLLPQDLALLGRLLGSLFPTASTCPSLHSLAVSVGSDSCDWDAVVCMDSAALHQLPALTALKLGHLSLDVAGLRQVCALPGLLRLDLETCTLPPLQPVAGAEHTAETAAKETGDPLLGKSIEVVGRLQSLILPSTNGDTADAVLISALQHSHSAADVDRSEEEEPTLYRGLSRLRLQHSSAASLPLLSSVRSLTSLHLEGGRHQPHAVDDFSFLVDPSTLRGHLPHLRDFAASVSSLAPHPNCLAFLSAYRRQLRSLRLTAHLHCLAQPLVEAALQCQELRQLAVCASTGATAGLCSHHEHRFLSSPLPRLPRLHWLLLSNLPLLDCRDLLAFLRSCDAVEDLHLKQLGLVTLDLLPHIGRACPRLRRLRLKHNPRLLTEEADEWDIKVTPVPLYRTVEKATSAFPCLSWLSVVLSSDAQFQYQPSAVISLVSMLEAAPSLRYLFLNVPLYMHQQRLFERLTHLRALRLWYDVPEEELPPLLHTQQGRASQPSRKSPTAEDGTAGLLT